MTKTEVLDLLKENRDARGEANWKEMGDRTGGLIGSASTSPSSVRLRNKLGATTTSRSNFGTNATTTQRSSVCSSTTQNNSHATKSKSRSTARGQE